MGWLKADLIRGTASCARAPPRRRIGGLVLFPGQCEDRTIDWLAKGSAAADRAMLGALCVCVSRRGHR